MPVYFCDNIVNITCTSFVKQHVLEALYSKMSKVRLSDTQETKERCNAMQTLGYDGDQIPVQATSQASRSIQSSTSARQSQNVSLVNMFGSTTASSLLGPVRLCIQLNVVLWLLW